MSATVLIAIPAATVDLTIKRVHFIITVDALVVGGKPDRHSNRKGCADVLDGGNAGPATESAGDLARDVQPEAGPSMGTRVRTVDL